MEPEILYNLFIRTSFRHAVKLFLIYLLNPCSFRSGQRDNEFDEPEDSFKHADDAHSGEEAKRAALKQNREIDTENFLFYTVSKDFDVVPRINQENIINYKNVIRTI